MKLLFLGDSITEGVGASCSKNNYVNVVKRTLDCETVNYGVSGTRIGRQTYVNRSVAWNYDFRLRAQIMTEDADLVFVFGGTNDYGHGKLYLGNVSDRNPGTFCGELRSLIEYLCGKYSKEKLCFVLPSRRFDEDGVNCKGENNDETGATLSEYVEAMRTIITEYGVDVIDLFKEGFPKPEVNTGDEYTVDGVHPNDNGYALIAGKICDYIKTRR